jgi:hypothetical protein
MLLGMKEFRIFLAVLILCTIAANRAGAWGPEGHRVIGFIAEQHLTEKARAGIRELLGPDLRISDAVVAIWPDNIRNDRPETKLWHYVDIPFDAVAYDAQRDCPTGQCVVAQIDRFATVLGDTNATTVTHAEALRFLVHFVGDLHQPLHCAERNKDKGGNLCKVILPSSTNAITLHWAWDSWLLRSYLGNDDVLDYAAKLNAKIPIERSGKWTQGSVADWALESHQAAIDHTYVGIPIQPDPFQVGSDYMARNQSVVEERLMKAGIRLAFLLNRAFP